MSQSLSTVTSSATTLVGDNVYNATITVTVKDATSNVVSGKTVTLASNQTDIISPDSAVTNSSGVATFTVSSLGVHTSTFTATVTGTGVISNTASLTVANSPPVLTSGIAYTNSTYAFPLNSNTYPPLIQTTAYTLAGGTDADTGDTVSWICTYQTLGLSTADVNYAAPGTACTSLPTMGTGATNSSPYVTKVSTSFSTLTWTPTNTQRGTYAFSQFSRRMERHRGRQRLSMRRCERMIRQRI